MTGNQKVVVTIVIVALVSMCLCCSAMVALPASVVPAAIMRWRAAISMAPAAPPEATRQTTKVEPTLAPPMPTAKPLSPATPATTGTGLKYDETGCDPSNLSACRNQGQTEFVAVIVRNIQSGDRTLAGGIQAIQQLFASTPGSKTWDKWTSLNADPVLPTFVWCPAGTCSYPPDSAFPLMGIPALKDHAFKIAIVSAHAPADPAAAITKVSCPLADCWAGLLR